MIEKIFVKKEWQKNKLNSVLVACGTIQHSLHKYKVSESCNLWYPIA